VSVYNQISPLICKLTPLQQQVCLCKFIRISLIFKGNALQFLVFVEGGLTFKLTGIQPGRFIVGYHYYINELLCYNEYGMLVNLF